MKKRTFALILVLAMTIGAATVAQAYNTDGSIVFTEGTIVIINPDCCPCFGQEIPNPGCTCECHDFYDENDGDDFNNFVDLGKNLYFGSHEVGSYGVFPSVDNGSGAGRHTGVYVINTMANEQTVSVTVTEFFFGGSTVNKLNGAVLTLLEDDLKFGNGSGDKFVQEDEIELTPGVAAQVLSVDPAGKIKATWTGELDIPMGSANRAEQAQAALTWEITNAP